MKRYMLIHDWCDDLTMYSFRSANYHGQVFHCAGMDEEVGIHLQQLLDHFDVDYEPHRGESVRVDKRAPEDEIDFYDSVDS